MCKQIDQNYKLMIFSQNSQNLLDKMRICSEMYSSYLQSKFMDESIVFNLIIEEFDSKNKIKGSDGFMGFWRNSECDDKDCDSEICNYAYELYNNLDRFFSDGVLGLYTQKQAEWGAPEVRILKNDVGSSDINVLCDNQELFRGMSKQEHISKQYGQSWTVDLITATRFAKDTYSDSSDGIVVRAIVRKENIIYYDSGNGEKEVIVEFGCITEAAEIKT